jgi:predicted O-methyltransferase YrrM
MRQIIEKIYEKGSVIGQSGQVHKLHSAISREEGAFIYSIIQDDPAIRRTLEVGCAFGLSSLHICAAIRDREGASHTIIDPFQNTQWDAVGIKNLETAGIDFFKLLETKSEFALPQLLEKHEDQFDFIFIDGWHTFDHTLLDCFYATRLLRIGGVLTIDDVSFPSVRRVVDFLRNYPCYEELGFVGHAVPKTWKRVVARALAWPIKRRTWAGILDRIKLRKVFDDRAIEMIALRKIKEDTRNWDWHVDQF